MMKEISLQDCLIDVIDNRGVTPHKRGTEWKDFGIPVYSANNIKTTGIQKKDEIRYIDEKIYDSWMKIPLEKGDILLTSEAPAGEVFYWDSNDKIIVGQRLYGLKVKKEINSKYLKYYLQSSIGQKAILSQQSGSTVSGISAKTFSNIKIHLPEKNKQDDIGEFLYKLDKKIETNNTINFELESMAKTLYDYWFLQFDFPNDEGKPYKSSGGKMVWNEQLKREIPEGWGVTNFYEEKLCSIIGTGVSKFDKKVYLATANINNEKITDGEITDYESRESRANMQPKNYSVWFAKMKDSIKHIFIPDNSEWFIEKYILSTGFYGLQCNEITFAYVASYIKDKNFEIQKNLLAHGSTQKAISDENLKKFMLAVPTINVLRKYADKVNLIFEMKFLNLKENQELSSLRDFLLPLLMNGQVTFKE